MPLDWKTKPVGDSDRWLFEPIPKPLMLGDLFLKSAIRRTNLAHSSSYQISGLPIRYRKSQRATLSVLNGWMACGLGLGCRLDGAVMSQS